MLFRLVSICFALSGILIAFRKYPGRSAEESLAHMKKVGQLVQKMFAAYRQPG